MFLTLKSKRTKRPMQNFRGIFQTAVALATLSLLLSQCRSKGAEERIEFKADLLIDACPGKSLFDNLFNEKIKNQANHSANGTNKTALEIEDVCFCNAKGVEIPLDFTNISTNTALESEFTIRFSLLKSAGNQTTKTAKNNKSSDKFVCHSVCKSCFIFLAIFVNACRYSNTTYQPFSSVAPKELVSSISKFKGKTDWQLRMFQNMHLSSVTGRHQPTLMIMDILIDKKPGWKRIVPFLFAKELGKGKYYYDWFYTGDPHSLQFCYVDKDKEGRYVLSRTFSTEFSNIKQMTISFADANDFYLTKGSAKSQTYEKLMNDATYESIFQNLCRFLNPATQYFKPAKDMMKEVDYTSKLANDSFGKDANGKFRIEILCKKRMKHIKKLGLYLLIGIGILAFIIFFFWSLGRLMNEAEKPLKD